MTPEGARRLLEYLAQQDAETTLRFDLQRLGPASEAFDHGWPHHPAQPEQFAWVDGQYLTYYVMGWGRN